jgi:hypothetical protein
MRGQRILAVGAAGATAMGVLALAVPAQASTTYPTTLTEAAPTSITYGASSAVTGRLVLQGTSYGLYNVKVSLYSAPSGSSSWTLVATHATNTSGWVTFIVAPKKATQYELKHAADANFTASSSAAHTIKIHWAVSASLTTNTVKAGKSDTLTTAVSPNAKGTTVTVQRKTSSATTWTNVKTLTLSTNSNAAWTFNAPGTKGTYDYRVVKAATSAYLQGTATVVLTVN